MAAGAGRWCIPFVQGRGSGLGNELIAWARAWLMAREIGARCLPPAFGRNERGYGELFGTLGVDWLVQRALVTALPRVPFDEADYLAHGGGDVGSAFASFARQHGLHTRRPLVVTTGGLWGGIGHVERGLEFVRTTLYASRHAGANLAELAARRDPARLTVAMHVRRGDFEPTVDRAERYRHRFNVALPLAWFSGIGRRLRDAFGERVQFQLFSDADAASLAPLAAALRPLPTACSRRSDVSDLLALSQADLLVCSVSSYSVWAAALSDAPYVWFEPQLHRHDDGRRSIWGHEAAQQLEGSATRQALAADVAPGRAFALGVDQALDTRLIDLLEKRLQARDRRHDLVFHGVCEGPPA